MDPFHAKVFVPVESEVNKLPDGALLVNCNLLSPSIKCTPIKVKKKHVSSRGVIKCHFCAICLKQFSQPVELEAHIEVIHGSGVDKSGRKKFRGSTDQRHMCDICLQVFSIPATLELHLISHKEKGLVAVKQSGRRSNLKNDELSFETTNSPRTIDYSETLESEEHYLAEKYNNVLSYKHQNSQKELEEEEEQDMSGNRVKCDVCQLTLRNKFLLQQHLKKHKKQKIHKKTIIDDNDDDVIEDKITSLTMLQNKPKKPKINKACKLCSRVFRDHNDLLKHLMTHRKAMSNGDGSGGIIRKKRGRKPRIQECEICQRIFPKKAYLDRHILTHYMTPPPQRKRGRPRLVSKQTFVERRRKRKLMEIMGVTPFSVDDNSFVCVPCDKTFGSNFALKRHILNEHDKSVKAGDVVNDDDLDYECEICLKVFGNDHDLQKHILTHTVSYYPYQCKTCDDKFRFEAGYIKHLESAHSMDKAFACSDCEKSYATSTGLLHHMRVH